MLNKNINGLIDKVISMVKDVPEEYRKISFEILLNYFLTQSTPFHPMSNKNKPAQKVSKTDDLQAILSAEYDWASTGIKKLNGIMQYIRILDILKNEFSINESNVPSIQKILKEKFRQKKSISAISMSLMKSVGNYVDRTKTDDGYKYRITVSGRGRLQQAMEVNEE